MLLALDKHRRAPPAQAYWLSVVPRVKSVIKDLSRAYRNKKQG